MEKRRGEKKAEKKKTAGQTVDGEPAAEADFPELSRNQTLVEGWSEVLPPKAEQELKQLQTMPPAEAQSAGQPGRPDPKSQPSQQQAQQAQQEREALSQSLRKAVELAPKVQQLAREAAEHLGGKDVQRALPKQQEALRLLKEIAQSLPKQQPQNQDQQNEQQKPEEGAEKPQQNESASDPQQQNQQQRDLSQRQAEAVLQKVRERERRHQELRKQLWGRLPPGKVDKDW